ncbi:MAG: hypothetical protein IKV70_05815 [Phascolarctobacterium sp.]|nr:hypothetical protein [Phascolarctobacterium sp.]
MMEMKCNDIVFGEMIYKHRWYKNGSVSLFGCDWDIVIAVQALSGGPINKSQQECYLRYQKEALVIRQKVEQCIINYINNNIDWLALSWMNARKIVSPYDLADVVSPSTLLFKQDGTTLILFNCAWDKEHGIAIKLYPEFEIGLQDMFL